jgi:oligopeptide transport system substrate-binding protein
MLFYSANGHVKNGGSGSNYSNYSSKQFDAIFEKLETMPNSPERLQLIRQAQQILAEDAPLCWLYFPVNTSLTHAWLKNYKPNGIAYDTLQYLSIDTPEVREVTRRQWNEPQRWPFVIILIIISVALIIPKKRTAQ